VRPTHSLTHAERRLELPASPHESTRAHGGHAASNAASHASPHAKRHTPTHAATTATAHSGGHAAHAARASRRATVASRRRDRHEAPAAEARLASRGGDRPADPSTASRVHSWEAAQGVSGSITTDGAPELPAAAPLAANDPNAIYAANLAPVTTPELPRIKSIEEEAATPLILPSLYDRRGHLLMPAPLYGTHEVLLHQNLMADHDGVGRVRDDSDLTDLRRERKLVPLPMGETLHVDERLPANRRYARPWTADFLSVLSGDFFRVFRQPLQVNSAVRTVDVQERLLRTNGNAAPVSGDTASPHLTGQAVDIGKRGMSTLEIAWMRTYLQPLIEAGKIDVEEEFQQSCFHISVYRAFEAQPHVTVAAAATARKSGEE
jgi:hypothetical protein